MEISEKCRNNNNKHNKNNSDNLLTSRQMDGGKKRAELFETWDWRIPNDNWYEIWLSISGDDYTVRKHTTGVKLHIVQT